MGTSLVPAMVDALFDALTVAFSNDSTVTVYDGPPIQAVGGKYVGVGMTENPLAPAVYSQQEPAGLGASRRNEAMQIQCQVSAWSGSEDMKATRDDAYEIFGVVEDYLRENADLGVTGAIYAEITTHTLQQPQTDKGAVATIDFVVALRHSRM